MQGLFDYWEFLAGIGLFLWGMSQLELAIKELAGNSFKNLLHTYTDKAWKGILVGTLTTAILQSSSLVTLMVLAFLGAVGGTADKKRLALANFGFNFLAGIFCFFWIDQLIFATIYVFDLTDPLMELVLLNSLINGLMILAFFPFLASL